MKKKIDDLTVEEQEEVEEETTNEETPQEQQPSMKEIVITECKRIIKQYKELMANSDDWKLKLGFEDESKNDDECVNHIMNNLTSKRIYGGADSLMYEYIHEYYVDDIKAKDNWSNYLSHSSTPSKPKAELSKEQKAKLMKQAEEDFIKEQKRILEEKEKERIKLEKEKEKARKEKEALEKQKAFEEAKKNGAAKQMSIFDV